MVVESKMPDKNNREFTVEENNGIYYVEAEWLGKIMLTINPNDYEGMNYFQKLLRNSGIIDKLEEMGIQDGDTVSIYDFEFDYMK